MRQEAEEREQLKRLTSEQDTDITEERKKFEQRVAEYEVAMDELREELSAVQAERDDIFAQAEGESCSCAN